MIKMPDNYIQIETMSWESLRERATKELATIPDKYHVVFETVFGMKWPQFRSAILSLAEEPFDKISTVREKMAELGDLSSSEVLELATMATLNKAQFRSAKLEYYQVCRLLHTKKK